MSSFAQRRSSGLSLRTPQPGRTSSQHSRRSSQNSNGMSPVTSHIDAGLNDLNAGLGLGASLADELDQSWDEEEEGEGHYEEETGDHTGSSNGLLPPPPGSPGKQRQGQLSNGTGHQRADSAYDGSDYGDEEDLLPVAGFTPFLEKGMADVEALARMHGTDATMNDGIWERAIKQLRDLPPQLKLEDASTRLVTASASATIHLENTSRVWPQITHAIMTPWATATPLGPVDVEEVEALVSELVEMLPRPPVSTLEMLHHLNTQTSDVLLSLSNITDQLHMQKQASSKAAQHLKAVKDVVEALREEYDLSEEGIAWLENDNWNERIKSREAARVCQDVVRGFDEACNAWREKLVRQAGDSTNAISAGAA